MKKHHIYSSFDDEELGTKEEQLDAYREFCDINDRECGDEDDDDNDIINSTDFYNWRNEELQSRFDDEMTNIHYQERDHLKKYLVMADLGLWNGHFDGGKIINGLAPSIEACLEDYNQIYVLGKQLCVEATHHDGTNFFKIKELTPKGCEWWKNHEIWDNPREAHKRLWNDSHLTHQVSLFKELYGW